jgi:predicted O-linked N-acetylglucosamine transferase (SPINDLY family)
VLAEGESALLGAIARGDLDEAQRIAVVLIERHPTAGLAWKVLGALLWEQGDQMEALAAMWNSAQLLPQDAEAHCNLGYTLTLLERFAEAERYFEQAIRIDPGFSIAHYRLGMCCFTQGRVAQARASLARGLAVKSGYTPNDDPQNHSNLLFVMSHDPAVDAATLLGEHRCFSEEFEAPLRALWPRHTNERHRDRTLQVGFVSGDLYNHSVGQFLEPILTHLVRATDLRLHGYCTHSIDDDVSRALKTRFHRFSAIDGMPDQAFYEKVLSDQIDILIDLSGHTGHNRLPVFARKPAPVQVSWLGYPGTTGLSAMDYYLADPCWLPPGRFDHQFTEKLVYLPDRWAFTGHPSAGAVSPLPALANGHLTFGSFHRLGKINAVTVKLWADLLTALPDTKLQLAGILNGQESMLRDQFLALGIDGARLTVLGRLPMDRYLQAHDKVDITLDTLAYSGATTTMHSLWMGVPVLTVAGLTPQANACAGILAHVDLQAFVAADLDGLIAAARYWRAHLQELAALRARLRSRVQLSPGGNPELIAAHIRSALRHMWHSWCLNQPAASFDTRNLADTGHLAGTGHLGSSDLRRRASR